MPAIPGYVSTITYLYLAMGLGTALTLYLFLALVGPSATPNVGAFGMGTGSLLGVVSLAWSLLILSDRS